MDQLDAFSEKFFLQRFNVLQILLRRTAAVIAHAPQTDFKIAVGTAFGDSAYLFGRLAQHRLVPAPAVGHDPRAIVTDPLEQVGRQMNVVVAGSAEQVAVEAGLFQNLHKSARMAERIKVDRRGRLHTELFAEIRASGQNLAHKALAGRHIAVRLQVPAAHNMPLARTDKRADFFKQRRFVFLDPAVQQRFVVVENEAVEPLAQSRRDTERRERFGCAFLPLPLPDGIEMRVADHVYTFMHIEPPQLFFRAKDRGCLFQTTPLNR